MANYVAPGKQRSDGSNQPGQSGYSGGQSGIGVADRVKDAASSMGDKAKEAASSAADKAKDVGSAVSEKAKDFAEKAKETASGVAEKAKDMASAVASGAGDATTYLGDRAGEAASSVGCGLKSLGNTIRENTPNDGMFGDASTAVANSLESTGRYLQEEGLSGIAEDMTNMIRRNPIPALLVGVGVGFLIARATTSRS